MKILINIIVDESIFLDEVKISNFNFKCTNVLFFIVFFGGKVSYV